MTLKKLFHFGLLSQTCLNGSLANLGKTALGSSKLYDIKLLLCQSNVGLASAYHRRWAISGLLNSVTCSQGGKAYPAQLLQSENTVVNRPTLVFKYRIKMVASISMLKYHNISIRFTTFHHIISIFSFTYLEKAKLHPLFFNLI